MQVGQPVKGPGALGDAPGWLGLWEWVEGLYGVWVSHAGPWAPALSSQSAELTVGAGGPWVGYPSSPSLSKGSWPWALAAVPSRCSAKSSFALKGSDHSSQLCSLNIFMLSCATLPAKQFSLCRKTC